MKTITKIPACGLILLAVSIVLSTQVCFAKYSGGSGLEGDPYLISNLGDLTGIEVVDYDKVFQLTADIVFSGTFTTAVIAPNTDSSDLAFHGTEFTGTFYGMGHKITGLQITAPDNSRYVGLFGSIGGSGKIHNIILEDIDVSGFEIIGGLAGRNKGIISECSSTGMITGGYSATEEYYGDTIGGLVGTNYGIIAESFSTVAISVGDTTDVIGGLVGMNSEQSGLGSISNCYATGAITVGDDSAMIGGLLGYNWGGEIFHCYAKGVMKYGNSWDAIGGLVGSLYYGTVASSYFLEGSGPDNGIGESLTGSEMTKQASFVGWDFVGETANGTEDIWRMVKGGSPELAWQPSSKKVKLTVKSKKVNKGSGTVSSSPSGIDYCDSTCSAYFMLDTQVTLHADADTGSVFIGWSSTSLCSGTGTCEVTMDKAKSITAAFKGPQKLTVKNVSVNHGTGVVTSSPPGINCSSKTCSATFPYNSSVVLTAEADSGSSFLGWSPTSVCSGTGTCEVTMDKSKSVTAKFTK